MCTSLAITREVGILNSEGSMYMVKEQKKSLAQLCKKGISKEVVKGRISRVKTVEAWHLRTGHRAEA